MAPKSVQEIASLYISYFKEKEHSIVSSSSLVPSGDPTLLFTTAGMVQFKPLFTGAIELPYTKAASVQKCLRTTDLENVGKTERHCTFFEMLGNFSFGDYFKKEAIQYALEFSLQKLEIPKDKIWVTIYLDDDEAKEIWMKNGIPEERIIRLGKKDNFWGPAGDSGACGPCSELYLDRGISKGGKDCGTKKTCAPGCDCDRFLEYWNLVFNQFNQTVSGELLPLKQTGIDTGSGLERVALLLQEVDSVYDTDELKQIIQEIAKLTGRSYSEETKQAFRVITDHSRSTFFAISDHIYPDKTGRGYVIRRLIRRASLFLRKLGINEPFLFKLIPTLTRIYSARYPELQNRAKDVQSVILKEEELFLHTLEIGLEELEKITNQTEQRSSRIVSGKDVFKLYSTYGFPREMTEELLEEKGFTLDVEELKKELEADRNLSRASWKGKKSAYLTGVDSGIPLKTKFMGYDSLQSDAKILLILKDGTSENAISSGEEGIIVLDKSPFYAEGGGQLGDIGFIKVGDSQFQVLDTQKENDTCLHFGSLLKGKLNVGDSASALVDSGRRQNLANHHSGTHLLNGALRKVLGNHVSQKGSVVSPEYLRFDFSHSASMTEDQIREVESLVNEAIHASVSVETVELPIEEAKKSGALSMFDEKYGSSVRVVSMAEYSKEFCGGTHVTNTNELQFFTILKEGSPGAGTRRVEAICGDEVLNYFQTEMQILDGKVQESNLAAKEVSDNKDFLISIKIPSPEEVNSLFQEKKAKAVDLLKSLKQSVLQALEEKKSLIFKEAKKKEKESFTGNPDLVKEILGAGKEISGFWVVKKAFQDVEAKQLKDLGDALKSSQANLIALLGTQEGETGTLVFLSNKSAVDKGFHAGNLLKSVLSSFGGKGGGRPDLAQGGGSFGGSLTKALDLAFDSLQEQFRSK